ncbi:aminoglycoside phosphotransferase family protein [Paramicrobacterium humi]|nr:aminoglycoside phosphotransferase family protein [Microbacterium humi]
MTGLSRARSLAAHRRRWTLTPDGEVVETPSSWLQPVLRTDGARAMLKVARIAEEARGGRVLAWFAGFGAAPVLEHDDTAVLLERARGVRSLAGLSATGHDDEATAILCDTVLRLHAASVSRPLPGDLIPLDRWFRELLARVDDRGFLGRAAGIARELFEGAREPIALHGDVHHGNVLDFGEHGWLAIDPKGLHGDRVFDFANILCNPEPVAAVPLLDRRVALIGERAGIDRESLLAWTIAWSGLSAVWAESSDPARAHGVRRIGEVAASQLARTAG